ncbi:MAG: CopG family transcriptional regulator, partial [Mesorhizobium sp.]
LVSVPLIDNDSAVVRANVTFERGVLRAIDMAARERGITRSAFLSSAARKEIEAKH